MSNVEYIEKYNEKYIDKTGQVWTPHCGIVLSKMEKRLEEDKRAKPTKEMKKNKKDDKIWENCVT